MIRRAIIQVDEVLFVLRNISKGSNVSNAKHSAEMEANGQIFNCILKEKIRGRFAQLSIGIKESLTVSVHDQPSGYVVIFLTLRSAQLWIYIKREDLQRFYNAILLE